MLVTGPWLSGVTGVVAALSEQLPEQRFIEPTDLAAGEAPTAVVFVVSAAATLTESDCALLDAATAETDKVIGVVSKIDVHRNWEEVLAADREVLSAHAPRYRRRAVGRGRRQSRTGRTTRPDALVAAVSDQLANPELARRNRLRAWESRLHAVADRYDRDADGPGRGARVYSHLRGARQGAARDKIGRVIEQARWRQCHVNGGRFGRADDAAAVDAMKGPVLLEFGTAWCGYCRAIQPSLAALLPLPFGRAAHPHRGRPGEPLGRSFQGQLWPTLSLPANGKVVRQAVPPDQAAMAAGFKALQAE